MDELIGITYVRFSIKGECLTCRSISHTFARTHTRVTLFAQANPRLYLFNVIVTCVENLLRASEARLPMFAMFFFISFSVASYFSSELALQAFMDLVVAFTCGFLTLQAHTGRLVKLLSMMTQRSPFPCFQGKDPPESIVKKLRCSFVSPVSFLCLHFFFFFLFSIFFSPFVFSSSSPLEPVDFSGNRTVPGVLHVQFSSILAGIFSPPMVFVFF